MKTGGLGDGDGREFTCQDKAESAHQGGFWSKRRSDNASRWQAAAYRGLNAVLDVRRDHRPRTDDRATNNHRFRREAANQVSDTDAEISRRLFQSRTRR